MMLRARAWLGLAICASAFLLAQAPSALAYPVSISRPTVTGRLAVGQTLTATPGTWTDSSGSPVVRYEYQWRGCVDVEYCTIALQGEGDRLVIPAEVEGDQISLTVVAYDEAGQQGIGTAEETAPIPYATTRYSVSENVSGGGSLTGAADEQTGAWEALNLDCPGACGTNYPYTPGTSVELTARPAPGATFLGWSGACSGTAPTCSFVVSTDETVAASFTPAPLPSGGPLPVPENGPSDAGAPAAGGAAAGTGALGSDGVLSEREEASASVERPPARLLGLHAPHGRRLQALLACQQKQPCRLTLNVSSEAGARLVASHSFTLAPGQRTSIGLLLDHAGARLLSRRHRLSVTARLMLRDGGREIAVGAEHATLKM